MTSVEKNKKRSGAVAIMFRPPFALSSLQTSDLSTLEALVIRRSATVAAPLKLCFPGGGIELDESPAEAVRREFLEEVGIEIAVSGQFAENQTPSGAPLHWFLAESIVRDERELHISLQSDEVDSYEWRRLSDLLVDPDFMPNNLSIVSGLLAGKYILGDI